MFVYTWEFFFIFVGVLPFCRGCSHRFRRPTDRAIIRCILFHYYVLAVGSQNKIRQCYIFSPHPILDFLQYLFIWWCYFLNSFPPSFLQSDLFVSFFINLVFSSFLSLFENFSQILVSASPLKFFDALRRFHFCLYLFLIL